MTEILFSPLLFATPDPTRALFDFLNGESASTIRACSRVLRPRLPIRETPLIGRTIPRVPETSLPRNVSIERAIRLA
jgi:hypothetical protein